MFVKLIKLHKVNPHVQFRSHENIVLLKLKLCGPKALKGRKNLKILIILQTLFFFEKNILKPVDVFNVFFNLIFLNNFKHG